MTDNSSKFFCKILKTGLITASGAAIMFGSSGVLAVGNVNVIANATIKDFATDGASIGVDADFDDGDTLVLQDDFSIDTGGVIQVGGVNINGKAATQPFTFGHNATVAGDLEMNAVVNAGNVVLESITNGKGATVTGGKLEVVNIAANLIITGGRVEQSGNITNNLEMSNAGILKSVEDVGGTVLLDDTFTGTATINNAAGVVTIKGGALTLNNAAAGINFAAGAAAGTIVNVVDGGNAGDVNNTTLGDTIGTLVFQGNGTAGEIGAANSLAVVTFDGAGNTEVNITGVLNADQININNGTNDNTIPVSVINVTKLITGSITFGTAESGNMITLNANGGITGDTDFNGWQTATITLDDGQTITGDVDNKYVNNIGGYIDFVGIGHITGTIGATNFINIIRCEGAGNVQLDKAVKAVGMGINHVGADVTANQLITLGNTGIQFNAAGTLNTKVGITGNVDFQGFDGIVNISDAAIITGNIDNSDPNSTNIGILNFVAGGHVTGTIGGSDLVNAAGDEIISSIHDINIQGDDGDVVQLDQDVYSESVIFAPAVLGAASTLQLGASLYADVTFSNANANGGVLTFNGNDQVNYPKGYDFESDITDGANGTLNVDTFLLTASGAGIETINEINITDQKAFILNADGNDVTILDNGATINFKGANSKLGFANFDETVAPTPTIALAANLPAAAGGGGSLAFIGGQNNLVIDSDNPAQIRSIGAVGNKIASLNIIQGVTVSKTIDLSGVNQLDIAGGGDFTDSGATTAKIAQINIGAAFNQLGQNIPVGSAAYAIDAANPIGGNVNIVGNNINFIHSNSELALINTSNTDSKAMTLTATLDPGDDGNGNTVGKGLVTIASVENGKTLTINAAGGATLGTANHKLKGVRLVGQGNIALNPDIYAINFVLGIPECTNAKAINANLIFIGNTQLTQNNNINGDVDFRNNAAVITLGNGNFISGTVTSTDGGGNIVPNGTIELKGGYIGGNVNGLGLLKVGAGGGELKTGGATVITEIQGTTATSTDVLKLPANIVLTTNINKTGGNPFALNFTNGGSVSGTMGVQANPIGGLTTAGNTSFASAVFSSGPIITNGNTTFANSVNNIGPVTTNGTTTFTGAFTNTGIATFGGTTSFADTFNNTGAVTLAPSSINNFAKNVTATSFVATGATMNFGNSLAFNSAITGSNTTINLNAVQVAYTGQSSFSGKLTIATSYDQAKNSGGNIVIKAGSKMDLSPLDELDIQFNGAGIRVEEIDENTKFSLITSEDGNGLVPVSSVDKIKFFVDGNDNSFIKWSINTSSLTLSAENIADESLEEEITTGDLQDALEDVKEAIRDLINAVQGSDGDKAKNQLGFMTPAQKEEAVNHLIQDVVRPGGGTAMANTLVVANNITGNLSSLNSRMDRIQATQAAVAAGDGDGASFGIWGSPFVGDSTQKARNNISGYKSNSNGATVGFDGLIRDDLLLGVAYTRADTKIKQKNKNAGDKSKVQSNIYSLYGLYNLPNQNWFFEGIASYGDSRVKNYSQRSVALSRNVVGYQTAIGKYKSRSYTGQILAGYNYLAPEAINLTPMAGIRYSGIKDSGYTETGTTFQNLIVKGKKYNSVEGLAGVKVSKDINTGHMILTPELYGMLDYNFKGKTPAIDARLQGMDSPFPTNSFKTAKTSFNFGTGVTAKYKMMEYGINYDANVASKYFAQQGSLKIRVNF